MFVTVRPSSAAAKPASSSAAKADSLQSPSLGPALPGRARRRATITKRCLHLIAGRHLTRSPAQPWTGRAVPGRACAWLLTVLGPLDEGQGDVAQAAVADQGDAEGGGAALAHLLQLPAKGAEGGRGEGGGEGGGGGDINKIVRDDAERPKFAERAKFYACKDSGGRTSDTRSTHALFPPHKGTHPPFQRTDPRPTHTRSRSPRARAQRLPSHARLPSHPQVRGQASAAAQGGGSPHTRARPLPLAPAKPPSLCAHPLPAQAAAEPVSRRCFGSC